MISTSRRSLLSLGSSAVAAIAGTAAKASTPGGDAAALLLDPYYRELEKRVELPRAAPNPVLDPTTEVTRLTFGSCNNQVRDQGFWDVIAARDPQLFLYIGDNVYGDPGWDGGADLGSLRRAYERLAAYPQFDSFRRKVPMLTVWDDHDFGFNDSGGNFPFKRWSEHIYETFWDAPEDVRSHEGAYHARIYGPEGRRLQVILLDTRVNRSTWTLPAPGETLPLPGRYILDDRPETRMLSDEQWSWLAGELARPADLRLVVSSIQVSSDAHRWEGWQLMPRERERLHRTLAGRAGGGLALLSGDRHVGGIYRTRPEGFSQGLWEITSSSLNQPNASNEEATRREPDGDRVGPMVGDANFGGIAIDWAARTLSLTLYRTDGEALLTQSIDWSA